MPLKERFFCFILALFLLLAAAFSFIISFSIYAQEEIEGILRNIYGNWQVAALGFAIVIIGLWILSKTFKTKEKPRMIYKSTPQGQYMISFSALESMVIKAAKNVEGLKDLQPIIVTRDNKLKVLIKGSIAEGYQIPALCEELQEAVKNYLEEMSGVMVEETRVLIENVVADNSTNFTR